MAHPTLWRGCAGFALMGFCALTACSSEPAPAPVDAQESQPLVKEAPQAPVPEVSPSGLKPAPEPVVKEESEAKSDPGAPDGSAPSAADSSGAAAPKGAMPAIKGIGSAPLGGLGTRGTGIGGGGGQMNGRSFGTGIGTVGRGGGGANFRGRRGPQRGLKAPAVASEGYESAGVNGFVDPGEDPLSTFAIDVDTGSYTLARRRLLAGQRPAPEGVRVEEFVNFFEYDYPLPTGELPFAVAMEAAPSPFAKGKDKTLLMRVGVQGRRLSEQDRKPVHLVFLVDNSGSMGRSDKLPLAQQALHLLVNHLKDGDTVALCTYAGSVTEVLEPTGMSDRKRIHDAIEKLQSGGGTAMADGMETAYKMAYKHFKAGHVNRVIVLSDGDANIGQSSHEDILKRIEHYTLEGVTLSTIGLGTGNYKDNTMERLANKGNGNYYYIDSYRQARRVFKDQLIGTLQVIAKDVKIQVEFDPDVVARYRLIGYENRKVADKDFRNDAVDAGEIGAGHQVTALYEIELVTSPTSDVLATARLRHKAPQGARAKESVFTLPLAKRAGAFEEASQSTRRAVAVMGLAEKLRGSKHAKGWRWGTLLTMARVSSDKSDDHKELIRLIEAASSPNLAAVAISKVLGEPGLAPPHDPFSSNVRPSIKFGNPTVNGALDKNIVRRVVRRHAREIKYCYEMAVRKKPSLQGKLSFQLVIGVDGKVKASTIKSNTVGDDTVGRCVAQKARRWVFPQPGDGVVRVVYPVVMTMR